MTQSSEGCVLTSFKYGDSQLILHVYTRELGKISVITSRKRKKGTANFFQPLYHIAFKMNFNAKREIHRISDIQFVKPYSSIPFSVKKSTIAQFIAEILDRVVNEQEKDEGLFMFIIQSFHYFDQVNDNYQTFHLSFLSHLLKYLGYTPVGTSGSFFSPSSGYFSEELFYDSSSKEMGQTIDLLMRTKISNFDQINISRKYHFYALELLVKLYQYHFQIKEIKSYEVLKQVFD